jgi:hypothetical protein
MMMEKVLMLIAATALVVVEHDGVKYGPDQNAGADFELTDVQAKPLLAVGAIEIKPLDATGVDAAATAATATKAKK